MWPNPQETVFLNGKLHFFCSVTKTYKNFAQGSHYKNVTKICHKERGQSVPFRSPLFFCAVSNIYVLKTCKSKSQLEIKEFKELEVINSNHLGIDLLKLLKTNPSPPPTCPRLVKSKGTLSLIIKKQTATYAYFYSKTKLKL